LRSAVDDERRVIEAQRRWVLLHAKLTSDQRPATAISD
jgi:hypothetical protein